DPYIETSEEAVNSVITVGVPGTFLVDSVPLLKHVPAWFPGASFQRKAHRWHDLARRMLEMPCAEAKRNIDAGTSMHSVVVENLERIRTGRNNEAQAEEAVQNVSGTFYGTASDTTMSTVASCILGLLKNPHILRKAQAELDLVIKAGHLPDLEDQSSLPYTTVIGKEALRWSDVVPIGKAHLLSLPTIPHLSSAEGEYKGYQIPAGALVIGNAWPMLHDESVYEDPFEFSPDCFIDRATGKLDFRHACWSFGRRICPGRYVAFSAVWLAIVSLIYVFDLEKER
ncbi:cytochrome P450, partial [Coprinellus micaceus]